MHICKYLKYQTHSQRLLHRHINDYHEEIRHPCKRCDYVEYVKGLFKIHFEIKHGIVTHKCKECNYEAKSITIYLRNHNRSTHESVILKVVYTKMK